MAPTLLILLLVAAAVVFWLPEQVARRADQPGTPQAERATAPESSRGSAVLPVAPAGPDTTPWSEAQLARLRKEAQDVLEDLLEVQFDLQERGVEQWAADPFAAAAALASEGDALYRQREYEQATGRYREGLAALEKLRESLPQEVDRQLQLAEQSIENGDAAAAGAALELAAVMEPENADLEALRSRLEVLPRLLEMMQQAAAAEQAGDLARAEQLLVQATALDPAHQRAAAERARVAANHLQAQFNDAMSEGYNALDANRFETARKAFQQADRLQPGSPEAANALQEVAAAETAHRLATLKGQGAQYEQQERWQEAVTAYEQAQKIDPTVLFAAEGLQRSRGRAQLDSQFHAAIDKPERLSDEQVARAAATLLQQARAIDPRGPVLAGQIARLDKLLLQANTPIPVTLYSDMQTEVIVYKVARLGRFQQQQIELRPGTYTAVGQREGYRDVRRQFTVSHDREVTPVTIRCTEPI